MRSISNVVDVTNYVMHVLREPAARVRPREARRTAGSSSAGARPGEELRTLDGDAAAARRARPADHRRRAGGRARGDHGRRSRARSPTTTTEVLLEAANFEPIGILQHVRAARRCAPRARTAGRRASTRTWPSPPPCSRAGCSSISPAPSSTGQRRRARRAARAPGRHACGPSARDADRRPRGRRRRAALDPRAARLRGRATTGTSPSRPGARAT